MLPPPVAELPEPTTQPAGAPTPRARGRRARHPRAAGTLVLLWLVATHAAVAAPARAQQEDERDRHRALQWSTAAALTVTSTLGTMLAINKPTLFGDGRCAQGSTRAPVLGDYGCEGLSVLHGVFAIVSFGLYAVTATYEATTFGWPGREDRSRGFDVASGIHLVGVALLPFMGLLAAVPELIGMEKGKADRFQRVMRTLHLVAGYTTLGTYLATAVIELELG